MGLSIEEILLRITGEGDDATTELEKVSAELDEFDRKEAEAALDIDSSEATRTLDDVKEDLAAFARRSAEAKATVDATSGKAILDELEAKLLGIDRDNVSPEVDVRTAKALGKIQVLQVELDKLEHEDVNVDVDVRRGLVEQIGGLVTNVGQLGGELDGLATSSADAGGGFKGFVNNIELFGQSGPGAIAVAAVLLTVIVSLGGAVAALVSSLALAVGGLGALAVAAGGVLVAALGLGFAALQRFKQQSDIAGTAAHSLKSAFGGIKDAAKALLPAADPALRALASGLRSLGPLIARIAPAFKTFGNAAAGAIRAFVGILSGPAISRGLSQLLRLGSGALRPLAIIAGRLLGLFLQIANAAMPYLIRGLREVARWLSGIATGTGGVAKLRGVVGLLVSNLSDWLKLIGAISRIFLGFISAAAGPGQSLVRWLTDGAKALADWLQSAKGSERLKQFFADTMPLAKALVETIGRLLIIGIQIGQFLAPALTPIVQGLNDFLKAVSAVLEVLLKIPAPVRGAVGTVASLFVGFKKLEGAKAIIVTLIGLFGVLGGALGNVLDGFNAARGAVVASARSIAQAVVGAVRAVINGARAAGLAIFNAVKGGFNSARGSVVSVARSIAHAALAAVRAVIGAARNAGTAIFNAVRGGFNSVRGSVVSAARTIASAAVDAVRALVGAATNAGTALVNAVRSGLAAARSGVVDAAKGVAEGAVNGVKGFVSAAEGAGRALVNGIGSGMKAAIGSVVGIAKSIWDAINSALPDISINIKIPTPKIPHISVPGFADGVRNFAGGLARVGERGPELVNLPSGSDVITNTDSRRMFGGDRTQNFYIDAPSGSFDPVAAAAQVALIERQRGER